MRYNEHKRFPLEAMETGGQAPDNGVGKARFVLLCLIGIPLPTR